MSRRSFISESRAHLVRSTSCIFQQGLQVSHDRIYAFQRCSKARTNIKIATKIALMYSFSRSTIQKREKRRKVFPHTTENMSANCLCLRTVCTLKTRTLRLAFRQTDVFSPDLPPWETTVSQGIFSPLAPRFYACFKTAASRNIHWWFRFVRGKRL